jgi:hypothetical protein
MVVARGGLCAEAIDLLSDYAMKGCREHARSVSARRL